MQLASPGMKKGECLKASVAVKNTGKVKGQEVVQLYL